jgi:hypothetical protein
MALHGWGGDRWPGGPNGTLIREEVDPATLGKQESPEAGP